MKVRKMTIDPKTNELVVFAVNDDGSETVLVWDIVSTIEGKDSALRYSVFPAGATEPGEIFQTVLPGLDTMMRRALLGDKELH